MAIDLASEDYEGFWKDLGSQSVFQTLNDLVDLGVIDEASERFVDDVNFISSLYEVYQDMTTVVEKPGHYVSIQTICERNLHQIGYFIDEYGDVYLKDGFDLRDGRFSSGVGYITIRQAFMEKKLTQSKSLFGSNLNYQKYKYETVWKEKTYETR